MLKKVDKGKNITKKIMKKPLFCWKKKTQEKEREKGKGRSEKVKKNVRKSQRRFYINFRVDEVRILSPWVNYCRIIFHRQVCYDR